MSKGATHTMSLLQKSTTRAAALQCLSATRRTFVNRLSPSIRSTPYCPSSPAQSRRANIAQSAAVNCPHSRRGYSTEAAVSEHSAEKGSGPSPSSAPKRTALYDLHVEHGAKMAPFAGYSMPLLYADLSHVQSHVWTREKASLFDVGHMYATRAPSFLSSQSLMLWNEGFSIISVDLVPWNS